MRCLCLTLLLTTSACVLTPYNDDTYGPGQKVYVSGYWIQDEYLTIEASPTRNGTYTQIAELRTESRVVVLDDGTTWYPYRASVVVPPALWSGEACTGKETFIRVKSPGGILLMTFDQVAPDGQDPVECVMDARERLGDTYRAIQACASREGYSARVEVPGSGVPFDHVGNVTIATPADQSAWVCLRNLDGNLSVPDSSLPMVELPRLESVSGDVQLTYSRPGLTTNEDARFISMPALTSIRGSLDINSPAALNNQKVEVHLGLNALTRLDGDLRVDVDSFNDSVYGLDALTRVEGDLSFETGSDDTSMRALPNLTVVEGNAALSLGQSTILGAFPALERVRGSFTQVDGGLYFHATPGVSSYPNLAEVGGDFNLIDAKPRDPLSEASFPALHSVGGTLRYASVGPAARTAIAIGGSTLTVRGLEVDSNNVLTTVGASNLRVVGSGPIEFSGNENLCTSEIRDFVDGQTDWTGQRALIQGNHGC